MAYDEELAHRLRACLQDEDRLTEKPMFGGLAFMIRGNIAVSASGKGGLLLRVGPARTQALAAEPHVEFAIMGQREMRGWLRVGPEAIATERNLRRWVAIGADFARSLPPK